MDIEIVLAIEEVNENIPYQMICETRYSAAWNTMRRKRFWKKDFTEAEKEKAEKIFRQAHSWYTKGVAEAVRMDLPTYRLWNKIARFCGMICKN